MWCTVSQNLRVLEIGINEQQGQWSVHYPKALHDKEINGDSNINKGENFLIPSPQEMHLIVLTMFAV